MPRLSETEISIERRKPCGRADIPPCARVALSGEPACRHRPLEQGLQCEAAVLATLEEAWIQHGDSGIREPLRTCSRATVGIEAEVAFWMVLRIFNEHEVRERIMRRPERLQREVRPDVAVDDDEWRIAEERKRREQSAAGAERLGALPRCSGS